MYSFRKSLVALVGLLVLVVTLAALLPLSGQGQGNSANAPAHRGPRKFYLTQTTHDGSQALTACAAGYHMASLWEILDPSNLSYDTGLGFTTADSGSGPPSQPGWIRTGVGPSSGSANAGLANCRAWTSADPLDGGTFVGLTNTWDSAAVTVVSPWRATAIGCNNGTRVWCVQD